MNIREYIDLKFEQYKLKVADTGSQAFASAIAWMLIIAIGLLALTVLAFGAVLLLGKVLDNYALGAFIVGGVLLLAAVVLYVCRKSLFRGGFVRMLSGKPNYRELVRSEELNAVRLHDAESSETSGFGNFGIRALRILLGFIMKK